MKKVIRKNDKTSGITLVALVVTIVVLIILATISISIIFSEDGIMSRARQTKEYQANADAQCNETNANVIAYLDSAVGGTVTPTEPNKKTLVTTLLSIQEKTVEAQDRLGNPIAVPGGFKVVLGELVQDGIVIEDSDKNQFVWIPVSNIDGGTDATKNKLIKVEDKETKEVEEVEITLGRYTFDSTYNSTTTKVEGTGKSELVQSASAWNDGSNTKYETKRKSTDTYGFYELSTSTNPEGLTDTSNRLNDKNAIYQTLGAFVSSVEKYHGYYIARYEASYASGETPVVGTNETYYKPASKESSSATTAAWTKTPGRLWNLITQLDASKVARNMYNATDEESKYVVSDLINSYMWDTAIVYIQAMGHDNYASANRDTTKNTTEPLNTGKTGDEKCNIYDMAANLLEWTTEYCTYTDTSNANTCTLRGGYYHLSGTFTSNRREDPTSYSYKAIGFRVGIYCKTGT